MNTIIALIMALVSAVSVGTLPAHGAAPIADELTRPREFVRPPMAETDDRFEAAENAVPAPEVGNNRLAAESNGDGTTENDKIYADNGIMLPRLDMAESKNNVDNGAILPGPDASGEKTYTDNGTTLPRPDAEENKRFDAGEGKLVGADELLAIKKARLDEKYAHMFELGRQMDELCREQDKLSAEYYALRERYEREYRALVAEWSRDTLTRS